MAETRNVVLSDVGRDGTGTYLDFGKHSFEYLNWVALTDPGYLNWILKEDFLDRVKSACREALSWAAGKSVSSWIGPTRAEAAAKAKGARLTADVNRIWKEKD